MKRNEKKERKDCKESSFLIASKTDFASRLRSQSKQASQAGRRQTGKRTSRLAPLRAVPFSPQKPFRSASAGAAGWLVGWPASDGVGLKVVTPKAYSFVRSRFPFVGVLLGLGGTDRKKERTQARGYLLPGQEIKSMIRKSSPSMLCDNWSLAVK
mmetsp:Transcript_5275/g.10949  ORF Transcript_5275/g.10949 Transcript_5275/m.10949 type:complete len:155 (-) Transcript_5275:690-1154(-)